MQSRCFLAVVAFVVLAAPARAQEEPVRTVPYDGYDLFCHVLHSAGITPITRLSDAANDPAGTMIIVFGTPDITVDLNNVTGGLTTNYLANGGSVLVATDRQLRSGNALRIMVRGDMVRVPRALVQQHAYNGEANCPMLGREPMKVENLFAHLPREAARDHPVFALLHRGIATNCPSRLDVFNPATLDDLLYFPFGFDEIVPANRRGGRWRYMVASPKDATPAGRALYIAGSGMFMNTMMVQTDNDNFQFSVNAVRWLAETPTGKLRTRALFIVDGEIIDDFDKKLTPGPPALPIPPAKAIARLLRGLEDERFFHRALAGLLGDNLGRLVAILAILATACVLLYGMRKLQAARSHVEAAVPALLGPQPALAATAPVEERQQAILRQPDFWDEARFLALKWFRQEFAVTPQCWQAGVDATFRAEGFLWNRWRLERLARQVLDLARSPGRQRLSRHDFFVLIETLRELSHARKDGRLTLLVEGKTVT